MTTILCIHLFDIDRSLQRSSLQINHSVTETFEIPTDDMSPILCREFLH